MASGRFTLASKSLELTVVPELGGRIDRLHAFGHNLLRRTDSPQDMESNPLFWGSYPMVPWCNRIPGGRLVFEGAVHQVPADFEGHAIHGRGFSREWKITAPGLIELTDPGEPSYPWPYRAWQRFRLTGHRVELELGIENTGSTRMPAGLGIHPWWNAEGGLEIRLPAQNVYPAKDAIPLPGDPLPVAGSQDLRTLAPATWGLDLVWTSLTEQHIDLRWPEWGIAAEYSFSAECNHVVLATVEEFRAVAIEPQTHCTDGHRRLSDGESGAIAAIEPGEHLRVQYCIEVRDYLKQDGQ